VLPVPRATTKRRQGRGRKGVSGLVGMD
jgi:hypothetical protein